MSNIVVTPKGSVADGLVIENQTFDDVLAMAERMIQACHFNEAVKLIDKLIAEVTDMEIAPRFSDEKMPYEGVAGPPKSLTFLFREREYKRQQILFHLRTIRDQIVSTGDALRYAILDIEATKREF